MDSQYKELQSRAKQPTPDLNNDDIPMSSEEEAEFMQTFHKTPHNEHVNAVFTRSGKSYNLPDNPDDDQNKPENPINFDSNDEDDEPTPQPKTQTPKPIKETPLPKPYKVKIINSLADLGASINLMPYSLYAKLSLETLKPTKMSVRLADISFQYPVGITENMLVEVGIFTFPADFVILEMEEDIETERMIFNINSAMKHSCLNDDTCFSIDVIDEILEEYFDALLDEGRKILHSIEGTLLEEEILFEFNEFIAMAENENSESESDAEEPPFEKITINTDYKIKTSLEEPLTDLELKPLPDNLEYVFLEEPSFLPVIISSQLSAQNKSKLKEIVKLLDTGIIYPIADSPWVSPIYCVPKKGGITVVTNENDELIPTRTVTGWRVCIDYRKLNEATAKDHFPLPFMDQMCMLVIFHDMIEESVEVFMDDFSVFGNSFDKCLNNLDKMLSHCKDAHLVLNWEKCHFMVKEGIMLGHKGSSARLEVDKAKINVISKLLPPTNIKGVRSFLGHAVFTEAFESLKEKLMCALLIVCPNWNLPFELMCDASDFAIGAILGQKDGKKSYLILSKTIVHTDHSALKHLFKKQDAKPRLIRWILLLQEIDIEMKDRKGTENVAADHLSRIKNDKSSDDSDVDDNFPGETLMEINTKNEPWFADFANYLIADIISKGMTYQQKNKFLL
ncbi:reverse transcriptase domain-containing protein [Tanacetum coccineum]|uniref:Reverse transcriptase domain-containing protein n=1 Tax=Tanacetum coccineum TaxID=301880 RepID=A0ABQ4Z953_9ASTR